MLVNGVVLAVNYALIALGITLIFSIMNILNFAHGALAIVAVFLPMRISTVSLAIRCNPRSGCWQCSISAPVTKPRFSMMRVGSIVQSDEHHLLRT